MRRLLIAAAALAMPVNAASGNARIAAAEARLVMLERQRQAQLAALGEARAPLVRLMAGIERLALRPPVLALIEPRSIDDMIHTHALLTALQPAIAAKAAKSRRDLARIDRLRAESVRTLEEIAAARSGLSRALTVRLAALPSPPPSDFPTAAPSRAYRLPASGQVLIGTGELSEGGLRARGLTLATAAHAAVVAPALGRIGYAGPFGGYGSIVILDHGHGWTTILTGLAKVQARTGERVRAGGAIGRMGGTGGRLTVELRHHGRPVDVAAMMVR